MKLPNILALALLLPSLPAAAAQAPLNGLTSSLTLYVYPPRNPIDWSSPANALRSNIGDLASAALSMNDYIHFTNDFHEAGTISSDYKSSLGHTLTHTHCTLPDGKLYDHWASLSGEDDRAVDSQNLFKDKIGVGVMFYDYVDGHIIEGIENVKRITFYKGDHEFSSRQIRPRYIQMELDPERCAEAQKMITFFESFHYKPGTTTAQLIARGPEHNLYFTNNIDPYESYLERQRTGHGRIGGGCAPFAAGLTKATGRYVKEFDTLWRTPVTVSEKLIGGTYDPRLRAKRQVSLGSLLFTPLGERWTYNEEGYKNRHLDLYDPQKIWEFAGNMLDCLQHKHCAASTTEFLRGHQPELRTGKTEVFRDKYEVTIHTGGDSGDSTNVYDVEQAVQGIIWRLP